MGDNPIARASRNAALKRHKDEVRKWKCAFWIAVITMGSTAGYVSYASNWYFFSAPPRDTKLRIVTHGYCDKKGDWHSYDNGEKITVKQWAW